MNIVTRSKKGGDNNSRKVVRVKRRPIEKQARKTESFELRSRDSEKFISATAPIKSSNKGSVLSPRQSARFSRDILVETFGVGDERTRTNISDTTLQYFIHINIQVDKPAVVTLPVSPQRHAFMVLVSSKNKKIMISDWFIRKYDGIMGYQDGKEWKTYNTFMEVLKKTYPTYIMDFFPIDKKIKTAAMKHHKENKNSLGCSFYIYDWITKHITGNKCSNIQ